MSKKSKTEIVREIQKTDDLGCELELIPRSQSPAAKNQLLNRFMKQAAAYVNEARDVLLIAVKIK